jgi:hypothetical protein
MSFGYAIHQAERVRTPAEQRAADMQLGRMAAAIRRLSRPAARPGRPRPRIRLTSPKPARPADIGRQLPGLACEPVGQVRSRGASAPG